MRDWKFSINEYAVINANAKKYLPQHVGELVQIFQLKTEGINDYTVQLQDGDFVFVKENELNKIDIEIAKVYNAVINGEYNVLHTPSNELVTILVFDLLHNQAEIRYEDSSMEVVSAKTLKLIENEGGIMVEKDIDDVIEDVEYVIANNIGKFEKIATELGQFTDLKNKQYGSSVDATYEMIKVLMDRYKNEDDTYTIPQSLLQHLLLMVRVMDKQNRIFNNPSGKGDSESPWRDIAGYSLIGVEMVENN